MVVIINGTYLVWTYVCVKSISVKLEIRNEKLDLRNLKVGRYTGYD